MKSKIVLLGEASVGKSSIVVRYVRGEFKENSEPTIGAAFLTQKCRVPEDPSKIVKFEIWDTAGQERFAALAPMYYRNAQSALVVFDITDMNTFHKAKFWVQELKKQANSEVTIVLVGNKADMMPDFNNQEVKDFAEQESCLFYLTSAKTGQNITEVFTDIARRLHNASVFVETSPSRDDKLRSANDISLTESESKDNAGCQCG